VECGKGLVVICTFSVHIWTLKSITCVQKADNYLFANAATDFVEVVNYSEGYVKCRVKCLPFFWLYCLLQDGKQNKKKIQPFLLDGMKKEKDENLI